MRASHVTRQPRDAERWPTALVVRDEQPEVPPEKAAPGCHGSATEWTEHVPMSYGLVRR
jgi:hypothetical protein